MSRKASRYICASRWPTIVGAKASRVSVLPKVVVLTIQSTISSENMLWSYIVQSNLHISRTLLLLRFVVPLFDMLCRCYSLAFVNKSLLALKINIINPCNRMQHQNLRCQQEYRTQNIDQTRSIQRSLSIFRLMLGMLAIYCLLVERSWLARVFILLPRCAYIFQYQLIGTLQLPQWQWKQARRIARHKSHTLDSVMSCWFIQL